MPDTVPVDESCQNVQSLHGGLGIFGHVTCQFATHNVYALNAAGEPMLERNDADV